MFSYFILIMQVLGEVNLQGYVSWICSMAFWSPLPCDAYGMSVFQEQELAGISCILQLPPTCCSYHLFMSYRLQLSATYYSYQLHITAITYILLLQLSPTVVGAPVGYVVGNGIQRWNRFLVFGSYTEQIVVAHNLNLQPAITLCIELIKVMSTFYARSVVKVLELFPWVLIWPGEKCEVTNSIVRQKMYQAYHS